MLTEQQERWLNDCLKNGIEVRGIYPCIFHGIMLTYRIHLYAKNINLEIIMSRKLPEFKLKITHILQWAKGKSTEITNSSFLNRHLVLIPHSSIYHSRNDEILYGILKLENEVF